MFTQPIEIRRMLSLVALKSSHEDLHKVISISSFVDLNSQSVSPSNVSQGMDPLLGIPTNNHGIFSSMNFSNDF